VKEGGSRKPFVTTKGLPAGRLTIGVEVENGLTHKITLPDLSTIEVIALREKLNEYIEFVAEQNAVAQFVSEDLPEVGCD
jgi:hypothetical protein